ncbi:VCBS repeat-containing protein [Fibrella forsythiae]|uniref:VCBS repeat-containing protein n=1 Tax=Fibrella forsythiae TaxID=2817061 RepID=A0ABS3JIQ5_9BACT|nr:VCBS repeat-containing protein [Fibrella forsythiae]MBO0949901.1 VCBS repeat-containing protein [Fibrella forsythiae]
MKPAVFLLILVACLGCNNESTLFEKTDPAQTGLSFANMLQETEQENILSFEYFYNGAGVAAGDLNNDGRVDLYFTGNQVPNKLFLNESDTAKSGKAVPLKFTDITATAGVAGRAGGWKTGVTLADVNADGWLDIYVCYSGMRPDSLRRNQLFINNHTGPGNQSAGAVPTFTERAAEYGLADSGYSVQANFFDYDRDGDLDCFLINHNLKNYQRKEAAVMRAERDYNAGDKLFRNDGGHFVDVSESEGIKGNPLGFGLGVSVTDANGDGWPDVYVANDFVEDDYLYINQRGTNATGSAFRDELRERINHTSYSAMGVDIADVNNDTRPDIFTLDMLPEDNARQKLLIWPDNWQVYQAQLKNGFWHQNMRNMLQINQQTPGGSGHFAEVGQLAGVSATDWSWGALLADFDLDGRKDLFVSNGLGRDLTNADFTKYLSDEEQMQKGTSLLDQLKQMPSTPTKNYIFRNVSGPQPDSVAFQNRQKEWGFDENTRSNGCAYADLDNDGDLDLITNNLNEPARIYRNTERDQKEGHFLKIKLKGPPANLFGIGATVTVDNGGQTQTQENYPTRGYLSASHDALLFGLPAGEKPTRIQVRWPDGRIDNVPNASADQTLTIYYAKAGASLAQAAAPPDSPTLFTELPAAPDYVHTIAPVNDFERQLMLPEQYSYAGPRMAVGDVNGDGQPDAYVCGTPEKPGTLLLEAKGTFTPSPLPQAPGTAPRKNADAVLADFNGDKRPDLFVVNGGYSIRDFSELPDQLWLNENGKLVPAALPEDKINGSCVTALDVDRDGDMDLFVGGFVRPNRYPLVEESLLLLNDGQAHFTPKSLGKLGLVTDAITTDVDHDGWPDLVVVGEWMPVTVLHNSMGQLKTEDSGEQKTLLGWWNRVEKADLDGDGDEDLIVGNIGQNTQFRATTAEPATMVYEDFDQNGVIDCFMTYYIQGKAYPAHTRDEIGDQVTSLRRTFQTYASYSTATLDQFFDPSVLERAQKREINETRTLVLENQNGQFVPHNLPPSAQYAPIFAILADDLDHDGKKDLVLMGNNSKLRLRLGKVDANHGLVLRNKGNFQFETVPMTQSGLFVNGDIRDVKRVGNYVLVGECDGPLKTFKMGGAVQ